MARLLTKKDVLRKAKAVVAEKKLPEPTRDQPLPVVELWYPRGGVGAASQRFVRVLEMNDTHIKGFEIEDEFDEEPGKPHTYKVEKVDGYGIRLLHLARLPKE